MFLDSNILIDAIKNKVVLKQEIYYINPIVYAEVLYGILHVGKKEESFIQYLIDKNIKILPIGQVTASIYTEIKINLNRKGTPVADNDLLIAASCIEHKLTLYTANLKHFKRIKGLRIEN